MYTQALKEEIMATIMPANFPYDKLSQPKYGMKVEKDVFVTMRDGVRIAVNIYRPDAEGQFPVLYLADSYEKDLTDLPATPIFHFRETNDIEWFISRGYVYVHADCRGTGHSEDGEWQFFSEAEQNDFYDIIEWSAQQPWCNGKVGMLGESLLAWGQWFAAAKQPPHLACIVPYDGGADLYRDVAFHGGNMALGFPTMWHATEIRGHYRLGQKPKNPNTGRWDLCWNVMNHPTFDGFWETRRADFSKIKVPFYSIGILHKVGLHLRGNLRAYEEIDAPKKLLLCHGDFEGDEMALFNSIEMRNLLLRWYDHWLKGNDTGVMQEAPVTIFVRGKEVYREEAQWPLPQTQYTPLYLTAEKSGAVDSLNDGGLTWDAPKEAKSTTVFHYPDPDWTHFAGPGTAVVVDGVPHMTKRINTFTTPALTEDTEVVGNIVLTLYCSSDQKDTDFFLRLIDQAPDKEQVPGFHPKGRILTRGWLKASHAATKDEKLSRPYRPYYRHDKPVEIVPGKVYKYEIEIWGTSCCFLKDHRIRLDLANYDSSAFDFGGHYYGLKVGTDTYYHDADHPSHIMLPIIPAQD